jgi:hypothetical protein
MLEHVAKLPCGYTATFRWDNNGMKVQWEPYVPSHQVATTSPQVFGSLCKREA